MFKNDCNTDSNLSWLDRLNRLWHQAQLRQWQKTSLRLLLAEEKWPRFARGCSLTGEVVQPLSLLDWSRVPPAGQACFGREPVPLSTYIAAFLVRLDQGLPTMAHLRRFLVAHPVPNAKCALWDC